MGTPRANTDPKKAAMEYSGVTRVTPATASDPTKMPAITESDISSTDTTSMVSVPPNSME